MSKSVQTLRGALQQLAARAGVRMLLSHQQSFLQARSRLSRTRLRLRERQARLEHLHLPDTGCGHVSQAGKASDSF